MLLSKINKGNVNGNVTNPMMEVVGALLWLEASAAQRGVTRVTVAGLDFGILWDHLIEEFVDFFLVYLDFFVGSQ